MGDPNDQMSISEDLLFEKSKSHCEDIENNNLPDEGIHLNEMKGVQRSPETQRNIKITFHEYESECVIR